jgi:hypothetical protein
VVVLVVLELQREKEQVREVCEGKGKEKVQRRNQGVVGAYYRSVALPFTSGGAVILILAA